LSSLGDLLRELRGKESLRDAAKRAGVSHTYLSILEKGYDLRSGNPVTPTPETLKLLSKAYKYPYQELLHISGVIDEETKNELIAEEKMKLIEDISKLPPNEQKLIEDMVKSLLDKQS
jgi:transcriptional regulator with XRE-family HTH domain